GWQHESTSNPPSNRIICFFLHADVRYWLIADVLVLHCICLLLTQSGHDRLVVYLRSIQKADRFTFRDPKSLTVCIGHSSECQNESHSALTSDHVRIGACRLRTNADNRLPRAAPGRVEGGDGIVEGRDAADVRPQSSVTHPLDDLTQLGTIGLDNEVDR